MLKFYLPNEHSSSIIKICIGLIWYLCSCNNPFTNKAVDPAKVDCDLHILSTYFDSLNSTPFTADSSWLSFARKIQERNCKIPKDSIALAIAGVFHSKGNIKLYVNYNEARDYFFAALKLRKSFYNDSIHLDLIRLYSNIALSYSWEGNYIMALKYFDSTLVERNEFKVFPDIYNHTKIGECYRFFGDYSKALYHLDIAWTSINKYLAGEMEKDEVAWTKACLFIGDLINNIAYCYQDMNDYERAKMILSNGQAVIRKISLTQDSSFQFGNNFMTLANIYVKSSRQQTSENLKMSESNHALNYFETAKGYYSEINDTLNIQVCYRNMAACLFDQKQFEESIGVLTNALKINSLQQSIAVTESLMGIYTSLGACHTKLGELEKGLIYYSKAMSYVTQNNLDTTDLPSIGDLAKNFNTSLYLLGNLGRVHLLLADNNESHFKKSQAAYDSLAVLLNYVRGNLMSDQAKLSLAEQSRFWIPDAVKDMSRLYFMSGDNQFKLKALQMSEQGKSFALIEASRLRNSSNLLPEPLQKKQNELTQMQIKARNNPSVAEELERETITFLNEVKSQAPSYYNLKYKGSDIDLETIQGECIDSNQAILEYFVQDSALYLFAITRNKFILDTQYITKNELQTVVHQFQNNLNPVNSEGILDENKVQGFCAAASSLYDILIGRIKDSIQLPERLIIIPDAMLSNLSFDALINNREQRDMDIPAHVKSKHFLVQQHSISYCFSISMLREMQTQPERKTESRLKLFSPVFQKNSKILPFMVYQKEEIERIREMVSSAELESAGSKENFLKASRRNAYVHVSTHGFAAEDPDSSFIAFDQKANDPDSTQFLFLNELYHQSMNVELMTLTACETAVGQLSEGEGNLSFARGFAYAGVKSFITTLWKIQTNGASQIMPGFYENFFKRSQPKDIALTKSKRDYLIAGKAIYPDDWAGLILVGSTTPAQIKGSDPYFIIYILSALLIALLLWKFLSRRNLK